MYFALAIIILIGKLLYEQYERKVLYPKREAEMKETEKRFGVKW